MPNGRGLPSEHGSAAEQFRELAAVMQEPCSGGMEGQATSQQGSRQASSALPGGQLRTAWSGDGVVGMGSSAGSLEDAPKSGAGDTADNV